MKVMESENAKRREGNMFVLRSSPLPLIKNISSYETSIIYKEKINNHSKEMSIVVKF